MNVPECKWLLLNEMQKVVENAQGCEGGDKMAEVALELVQLVSSVPNAVWEFMDTVSNGYTVDLLCYADIMADWSRDGKTHKVCEEGESLKECLQAYINDVIDLCNDPEVKNMKRGGQ